MLFAIFDTQPADARRLSGLLQDYLEQRDLHCRVEQFSRPELLLEFCRSYACTAVFLQVTAAGCPNLEIASRLRALSPETPVILTSDSLDCAPDGYRVRAFAYLLTTRLPESFSACMDGLWETLFSPANTLCLRTGRTYFFRWSRSAILRHPVTRSPRIFPPRRSGAPAPFGYRFRKLPTGWRAGASCGCSAALW